MPGIKPIAVAASRALAAPIAIEAGRCVASRHRASGCRACVEACKADALRFEGGRVVADGLACKGCLACVSACPTEAVSVPGESDKSLSARADAALEAAAGVAVFACHRAMEHADASCAKVVAVPCLARIDESLLCEQASRGAYRIVLVDAGCAGCSRCACEHEVEKTVACANAVLSLCAADVEVERSREFPPEVADGGDEGYDAARRRFLGEAADLAKAEVIKAVGGFGNDPAGDAAFAPTEKVEVEKRMRLLDAIDAMGAPANAVVGIRRFHTVELRREACAGCGVCAMFCPSGALRMDAASGALEWSAAECVGCQLCRDVCAGDAITLVPGVACGELLDFEPRVLAGTSGDACASAGPASLWAAPRGLLASRFFDGARAVDPAAERMRAKVRG